MFTPKCHFAILVIATFWDRL